ncbi:MAG: hypothetical protein ACLQAH_01215 [Limisphaerales bacterium]
MARKPACRRGNRLFWVYSFGFCRLAEQRPKRFPVRTVQALLTTPDFHKLTPSGGSLKRHEAIQWQMPLQIVQGVTHDLETMTVGAGCAMVERGVERMAARVARGGAATVGAVEKERNARNSAFSTLRGDERQILADAASVPVLFHSRPPAMVVCELEIVRPHSVSKIRGRLKPLQGAFTVAGVTQGKPEPTIQG